MATPAKSPASMRGWTCGNFSELPQMTFKTDSRFQKQLFVLNGILPAALNNEHVPYKIVEIR